MKRLSICLLLLMAVASAFADDPIRRTLIVRDGDVLLDDFGPPGKRAFVGLSLISLTPELREFFGTPKDSGVLVSSVTDNGPAAKAGLRVGDIITAVNGKPTTGYRDLREAIKDSHAGDSIRMDVLRGKARQTIVATAEEREGPQIRSFKLGELERELGPMLPKSEWHGKLMAPDNEELHVRIRDLEKRLQELEKRLQQK